MSWELQKAEDAASGQPGGSAMDEFIRRNVVMANLEDMVSWGRKNSIWPFNFRPFLLLRGNGDCFYQPTRFGQIWCRGDSRYSKTGRHDRYRGHRFPQDGSRSQAAV